MPLVAKSGGGGQEERAGDHEGDEGETEEEEGVAGEVASVGGRDGVLVGVGAKLSGLKDGHLVSIWRVRREVRSWDRWGQKSGDCS